MRVKHWLVVVLGVGVASASFGTLGCAGLLGDFTTEEGDGGIDSSVAADANGNADGTVNGPDGNGSGGDAANDTNAPSDGTFSDTSSEDAPSSEDVASPVDANDSASGSCGVGSKDCDGGCPSITDPLHGCADPNSCAACPVNHDAVTCTSGACAISACALNYNDCNGNVGDGCETFGACPCTPTSCPDGCCDNTGTCQTSRDGTCGIHGVACVQCGLGQACNSAGACDCAPGCGTCCSNHVCITTQNENNTTCGSGGIACVGCSSGTSCGLSGSSYQCLCNSATCANGCCATGTPGTPQGQVCDKSESINSCGLHGAVCEPCGFGLGCNGTVGQCQCGPSTCTGGCCTTDTGGNAVCEVPGAQSVTSCGSGGAQCAPCKGANTCDSTGKCSCPATDVFCGSVCSDPQTDPQNCGTCGHSCVDEGCSKGQCVQVTLASVSPGTGQGIALFPTNDVYFSVAEGGNATGTVQQISLPPPNGGCASNCSKPVMSGLSTPYGLVFAQNAATATQYLYVGQSGTGTITMLTNGIQSTVATGAGPVGYGTGLVADSTNLYYGTNGGGVLACPLGTACTGGVIKTPVAPASVTATFMAVDDGTVLYFSDFGSNVYRCTLPSCGIGSGLTQLVSGGLHTSFLHVDSKFIYWIDRETTNTTNCDGHISRSDKNTGTLINSYTTTACYPQGITSDASNVYWGALDGVYSCPLGGCPTAGPTKMGTAFTTEWIDQDTQFVYWVDNFGAVYRVAK